MRETVASAPQSLPWWIEFTAVYVQVSSCRSFPGLLCLVAADASLVGPSPHGARGFSSAADTNRIRDDILPG